MHEDEDEGEDEDGDGDEKEGRIHRDVTEIDR